MSSDANVRDSAPEAGGDLAFDIIVIGAGINGAAVAREASLRGFSVLVLEQGDLGGGTSSASSRLIHGGLRYLEHGELGLVRQSLVERERLLRAAPHLIQPLELYIPLYAGSRRRPWQIRAGMWLYDVLARQLSRSARSGRLLPRHAMLTRERLLERLPGLERTGLRGGASYYDARVDFPERLVLENMLDAVDHGAKLLTYARATAIEVDGSRVRGVEWRTAGGVQGRATAPVVVNASGPWVDRVLEDLGESPLIGGTKGSHLVVEPFPGAPPGAVYAEADSDGRPFFIIPWNALYLIGTTDEYYEGDPGEAAITDRELDYLITETERLFPAADIAPRVLYTQAGVRSLPRGSGGEATGAITRRHRIVAHAGVAGLYSLVGGKLTTHRAVAEELIDRVSRDRGRGRAGGPSPSRDLSLPGALSAEGRDDLLRELDARFGPQQAGRLWRIYGSGAWDLLTRVREQPELAEQVCPWSGTMVAELVHALEAECAHTLTDLLQRRSMAGLGPDFGLAAAPAAADSLRRLGLWDGERVAEELAAYHHYARRFRVRALMEEERRGSRLAP